MLVHVRWSSWIVLALATGCSGSESGDAPQETDVSSSGSWEDASGGTGGGEEDSGLSSGTRDSGEVGSDEAGDSTTSDSGADDGTPPADHRARYFEGRVHSPITPSVAEALHTRLDAATRGREDVFAKIGASSTVSPHTLYCFAGDGFDLGTWAELEPTRAYFATGMAADTSAFDRDSLAAEAGRSASWAIEGEPSPVQLELEAIEPRFALVHYGTNDMNLGVTFGSALPPFHENMSLLLDGLLEHDVIPVVFGITRRGDDPAAQRWVRTYNAVLRGMAERRQIPFVDLYEAIDPLPEHGLSDDGIHLEAFASGACDLTELGLEYGYNMRNLVALQALDRLVATLVDDRPAPDEPGPERLGDGSPQSPWIVDTLPFTDGRDTRNEGQSIFDGYACDWSIDQSGPEVMYRLDVDEATPIRAVVLDEVGADVDLVLLDDSGTPEACRARDHRRIEGTLEPGTYHFVVDTWVNDEQAALAGRYDFIVVPCADDDPACAGLL